MRRRKFLRLILALPPLTHTLGSRAQHNTSPPSPERIERPRYLSGDTWIYNAINGWNGQIVETSINTIRQIDADGYLLESISGIDGPISKVRRNLDFNLVEIETPEYRQWSRPWYPNYNFPLYVGKTWSHQVEMGKSLDEGKKVVAELESRVVGWETVNVPAGSFLALKIETSGWYIGTAYGFRWNGRIRDTLWYAPEVRNAVRYEYQDSSKTDRYNHDIHELVAWRPAPTTPSAPINTLERQTR